MKHKLLAPLTSVLVLSILLMLMVPAVEASSYRNVNFCVTGSLLGDPRPALNVWLYITYDIWDGGRTIFVREVTVRFDYLYQQGGYACLLFCNLETGRYPWNSQEYCKIHWSSPILYLYDWYNEGIKQYTGQPKVSYGQRIGQKGAYGVFAPGTMGFRLCADGNYMFMEFLLIIHMPVYLQIAWQFYYGNDLGAVVKAYWVTV